MTAAAGDELGSAAERLLFALARAENGRPPVVDADALRDLMRADLVTLGADRQPVLTQAGRARITRARIARSRSDVDPFLGQRLDLVRRRVETPHGRAEALVDHSESPLAWLARRRGRDGRPLLEASQVQAGERLRIQFTRAQLTPRMTANWSTPLAPNRRAGGPGGSIALSDAIVAARQDVRRALDAAGPEFAGLLVDVCCFLKGLEEVERDRGWPPRSAKVVLQLGLDRLARHYGLGEEARGRSHAAIRTWQAPDSLGMVEPG